MAHPKSLPTLHKSLLDQIIACLSRDPRIVGIAAAGSYASDTMDRFSDLDLVIAIDPMFTPEVMKDRRAIIDKIGDVLACFSGEHVGEPRLMICLFGPQTIHVDFKFVSLDDAAIRVDEPVILWEKDSCLSNIYRITEAHYPAPDIQWIEDRFWTWVHYAATKIARGEYFETLDFLSFIRGTVLSPLALSTAGHPPTGVRKIEKLLPEFSEKLEATIAINNASSLLDAVQSCIDIYRELRNQYSELLLNERAEKAVMNYISTIPTA